MLISIKVNVKTLFLSYVATAAIDFNNAKYLKKVSAKNLCF